MKIFVDCCLRSSVVFSAGHWTTTDSKLLGALGVTYFQHSHWPSYYITALSLVESFRMVKYFHALKGPIIGALSDATSAILCHKEPARRKNEPYFLLLAGSLCQG